MSLTINGRSISISEYVTLIIDAARKIIEKEQNDLLATKSLNGSVNTTLDKSGISVDSVVLQEKPGQTLNESAVDVTSGNSSFNTDSGSVLLRLPDGSLQTVEEYIRGIIKDASSHMDREKQNGSVVKASPEKETPENVSKNVPNASPRNSTNKEKREEITPSEIECSCPQQQDQQKKKSVTVKRSNSVQKVFNRIFGRGKSKSKQSVNDVEDVSEKEKQTSWQDKDETSKQNTGASPDQQVKSDDTIQKLDPPNNESQERNSKSVSQRKEIPAGKHKTKKRNSFRNMMSCFSSKSAQAD